MNFQKLKNKILGLPERLNAFLLWLKNPLNRFRFLTLLLAVDFIAFMSLSKSSYLQLLNPAAFLSVPEGDKRQRIELYFPRSLSLTGIEKIYAEDEAVLPQETNQPPAREAAKPLDDAAVQAEVILIKKKVGQPQSKIGDLELTRSEAMARRVIYELIAGPAGEKESLKARNLLKEKLFLRSLWTYQQTLYISTEKAAWEKMSPNEQKITEYCILESLKKNLPGEKITLLRE
ncbi:MAG: hypothetical protein J0L53_06780 [Spirochaetes bacterium]|nr:hypothetical protein [Spirochaetota bacterium]